MPNLFDTGDFTFHSGSKSDWKIDCDALSDHDIRTLARLIYERSSPFSGVTGVPQGGLRLAAELRHYQVDNPSNLLIVDDVYTTGTSMREHRGDREAIGVVVFAREPVTDDWITPLFTVQHVNYAHAVNKIHELTNQRDEFAATIAKQQREIKNLEAARDAYRNELSKHDAKLALEVALDESWTK